MPTEPDPYSTSMLETYSTRTAANTSSYFLPFIKPDMKILDIGCGPGSIALDLASFVPQGSITGIDSNETAINSARELSQKRKIQNATFKVSNVLNLPYEDSTFDIVCAHQVLIHLPNEPNSSPLPSNIGAVKGLKEMRRVCKPGGLVCARECDWKSAVIHPFIPGLWESMKLIEDLTTLKSTSPYGGMARNWALQAGWKSNDIDVSASVVFYSTPGEVKWWGETMARRLEEGSALQKGVEEGFISEGERGLIPDAWREWAGRDDGFFSMTDAQIICRK
ncbi:S-adenosyl-L-methionine-dependent methyltransferase [Penicillium angulare]|uniref:S-adenosyl-L-methionine-dependent methyltransferase n=1 Tax=Penicillium angulare TaxID=116970 RepID=A0A9W9KHP8_9EURO|nr:S-adenosyl-L-methionine-dependent methyltransferase [Penicillium angulare]